MILNDIKINTVSLTFDGTSVNLATTEILGCRIIDPQQINSYFVNPACHLIKLMRTAFATLQLTYENKNIDWKYVKDFNVLQYSQGLHL